MNTDNIWITLAEFGKARISIDTIYAIALDWNAPVEVAQSWFRNQLNSEANVEGVSLRINTLYDGCLNVYLRKFT
jgi:hypothetical protein